MEKYEVLKQVGEGSFGQVYKAKKRSDGEIVAFKVIRKVKKNIHGRLYRYRYQFIVNLMLHILSHIAYR